MMNSIKQMLETKNFLEYFIINWFLQPAVGCSLFLLDTLVRVMIHLLESTLSSHLWKRTSKGIESLLAINLLPY